MEKIAVTDWVALWKETENARFRVECPRAFFWLENCAITPNLVANLAKNLSVRCENPARLGVVVGSSKGDLALLDGWSEHQNPEWMGDCLALRLARALGAQGPILAPNAACATGSHALALGAQMIQNGRADIVLAGALEFAQHPLVLAAYRNMGALSKSGKMRPFDARRDGFVANSGAGLVILESPTHAQKRGAKIHGFLSGFSLKCDATHLTSMNPSGETIARAIEDALQKAGKPQIDYVNAHGTATRLNDLTEARALQSVFGRGVAVSSTKGLTGHLLGAAGAVEAILSLQTLRDGVLPPNLGLEQVDEEFDLDFVLTPRAANVKAVLSLNYGFGGHIGALILESAKS